MLQRVLVDIYPACGVGKYARFDEIRSAHRWSYVDHVERNSNLFFGIQKFEDGFFLVWFDLDQIVFNSNIDRLTRSDSLKSLAILLYSKQRPLS